MSHLICEPIQVATRSADREGFLVFADDALVAVVVHLDDLCHGDTRGQWFVEAGFGPCAFAIGPDPFPTPDAAQKWVLQRVLGQGRGRLDYART